VCVKVGVNEEIEFLSGIHSYGDYESRFCRLEFHHIYISCERHQVPIPTTLNETYAIIL